MSSKSPKSPAPSSSNVPPEFFCPLSGNLMKEPVIIATGESFDRISLHDWFGKGNNHCPVTDAPLMTLTHFPNHFLKKVMCKWFKEHNINPVNVKPVTPKVGVDVRDIFAEALSAAKKKKQEVLATPSKDNIGIVDGEKLTTLLRSLFLGDQHIAAAQGIKSVAQNSPKIFGEVPQSMALLVAALSSSMSMVRDQSDPQQLQEHLLNAIYSLACHESTNQTIPERILARNPALIPLLVKSLESSSSHSRRFAALTLISISANDVSGRVGTEIANLGGLIPIIKLLDHWDEDLVKGGSTLVLDLCATKEIKIKAVESGLVPLLVKEMKCRGVMDEILGIHIRILFCLSEIEKAVKNMSHLGVVSILLNVMKSIHRGYVMPNSDREEIKKSVISLLYSIVDIDDWYLGDIVLEERNEKLMSDYASESGSVSVLARKMLQKMEKF